MLARRFSLVCLVAALAGGGLAMLVQEISRPAYPWKAQTARACQPGLTRDCLWLLR